LGGSRCLTMRPFIFRCFGSKVAVAGSAAVRRRTCAGCHETFSIFLGILFFIIGSSCSWAEQTATIVSNDPIHFVKGTSRVVRPVQPDEVFSVTATNGDEITIVDQDGFQATLNRSLLKITGPSPTAAVADSSPATSSTTSGTGTNSTTASNTPPVPLTPTPAANPVPANISKTFTDPGQEDSDMFRHLNDVFQIPLFADANLWGDDVGDVAKRLHWPQESSTTTQASYRRYALGKDEVSVLSARAYSMALYGRMGHPTYISIVFANKGDFAEAEALDEKRSKNITPSGDEVDKVLKDLNAAVKSDAETINAQLTALLGPPEIHQFGPTANSREEVHRWNWKGHAILFSAPRNEYAAIRIVPSNVADHAGDVGNMDRETIKEELSKRIFKRDSGDVVLQQIPMVDQGPKGYCVPATWERYMRYVDVPADMYVLAMLGNTNLGGGASIEAIRAGVNDYVESYGRRIEIADVPLDIVHVSKFIDQGLPLMWTCFVQKDVEKNINLHTGQRKTVTDWDAYKTTLKEGDKGLVIDPQAARFNGHMRMIIGYNPQTNELAISDSWGEHYAERWITVKEAQTTTRNDLAYVQW